MKGKKNNYSQYVVIRIVIALAVFVILIALGGISPASSVLFFLLLAALVAIGALLSKTSHHRPDINRANEDTDTTVPDEQYPDEPSERSSIKLFVQQSPFTIGERFTIYDEHENEKYLAYGEIFEIGSKFHITDLSDCDLVWIEKTLFSFRTAYYINVFGKRSAEIVKEMALFSKEYTVSAYGWNIVGDFLAHDYTIYYNDTTVATISKEIFSLGDAYSVEIFDTEMELEVLATVIAIDDIIDD